MIYWGIIYVLRGIRWFLYILSWLIFINAIMSWFIDPTHPIRSFVMRVVEPVVSPFRRLTDRLNTSGFPIDFSPFFAYLALMILQKIIEVVENLLMYRAALF